MGKTSDIDITEYEKETQLPLSVRDAWGRHARSYSAQDACHTETFQRQLNDDYARRISIADMFGVAADYDAMLAESTAHTWKKTKPDERLFLSDDMRASISIALPTDGPGNTMRQNVFNDTAGSEFNDTAFAAWQARKVREFTERLSQAPAVLHAEKNWNKPEFGVRERLEVTQLVHNIQADVFGFKPSTVIPFMKAPEPTLKADGSVNKDELTSVDAYADHEKGEIAMNIYKDKQTSSGIHGKFSDFMDTVAHEGDHVFQMQIAVRASAIRGVEAGLLQDLGVGTHLDLSAEGSEVFHDEMKRRLVQAAPDDPGKWNDLLYGDGALASHARYMNHNYSEIYLQEVDHGAGHEGYLSNPMEQESRKIGLIVSGYYDTKPEARSNYIAGLRYDTHVQEEVNGERLTARETAMRKPDMCVP